MCDEHMEAVISRLEKTYGDTDKETGFVRRIRGIAGRIVENYYELLAEQMNEKEGITEQMKAEDQMLLVAKMNSIRNSAEGIVMTELIYS